MDKKEKKPRGYWTYERCYEEALKYETRTDFCKNNGSAYEVARKNGWLNDYDWLLTEFEARSKSMKGKHTLYTYEECFEIAKDCKTKTEFKEKNKGAYDAAQRNDWLKKWDWFVSPTIKSFNPNEKYKIYAALFEKDKSVYVGLSKERRRKRREWEHNYRKDSQVYKHQAEIGEKAVFVTLETGLSSTDAQFKEDFYKNKYAEDGWNVLNKGETGVGTSSFGGGAVQYTEEEIIAAAKQYDTRGLFYIGNRNMYYAAYRRGILDEMFGTERIPYNKKWVYETCQEEALKYETRTKFARANGAAYQASKKNGWLDEFFPKAA